mmetsp:Transcript_14879/g.22378  ORF Transcript_14879/g.22378 Transcript_14879/m.22378 type:complete len:328 (+) Transcript_14879:155-1138(+)|eukprot:CAMPEP_0185017720 /NCGR_PEP_ID=MMETSP1103-20130426/644_1 /TAXON_ID=36769 /ORGANISM="Paraphysomonas bandaiensis, Strain Caron Lab Isolate" /LENGTH=327 /DNA_ID=CAMNT_0027547281 /DNA_START=93 /DNA_END=1076 /DNA_ORIENTATION=-
MTTNEPFDMEHRSRYQLRRSSRLPVSKQFVPCNLPPPPFPDNISAAIDDPELVPPPPPLSPPPSPPPPPPPNTTPPTSPQPVKLRMKVPDRGNVKHFIAQRHVNQGVRTLIPPPPTLQPAPPPDVLSSQPLNCPLSQSLPPPNLSPLQHEAPPSVPPPKPEVPPPPQPEAPPTVPPPPKSQVPLSVPPPPQPEAPPSVPPPPPRPLQNSDLSHRGSKNICGIPPAPPLPPAEEHLVPPPPPRPLPPPPRHDTTEQSLDAKSSGNAGIFSAITGGVQLRHVSPPRDKSDSTIKKIQKTVEGGGQGVGPMAEIMARRRQMGIHADSMEY